jgi:hypothetical protein
VRILKIGSSSTGTISAKRVMKLPVGAASGRAAEGGSLAAALASALCVTTAAVSPGFSAEVSLMKRVTSR